MSLLKRRLVFVGIVSVALTGALFASESSYAAKAKPKTPAVTYKNLTSKDFNTSFSAMKALKPLAAKGTGSVAVILPDTVSSTRWTAFDAPYLAKALKDAGLVTDRRAGRWIHYSLNPGTLAELQNFIGTVQEDAARLGAARCCDEKKTSLGQLYGISLF